MHVFAAAEQAWRTGQRASLATVIGVGGSAPRAAGARMLVYEDGSIVGTIGGGELERRVIDAALETLRTGAPTRFEADLTRELGMCCGGRMEVFVEPLECKAPMVIFGAGHVSHATAQILRGLAFDVTVVDEREELLTEERFGGCQRIRTDPVAVARDLRGAPDAHWLVLTHDHALDQDIVENLLPKQCAWIGMIGSQRKVARFLVRYRAAGLDPELFSKLSAPVGLDIGAETPSEIAIAIAAELIRVRRRAEQSPLPLSARRLAARGSAARPPAWGSAPDAEDG